MKPVPDQVKARQAYERYKAKTNGEVKYQVIMINEQ